MGPNKMLVIVDYQMGNVRSVAKAFELLGAGVKVSNRPRDIKMADHLVLPGVGAFGDGMKHLKDLGLIGILTEEVAEKKKPFLGICLGMQLLARDSEEFGYHQGLSWLEASVKSFAFVSQNLKVPHVGWNEIKFTRDCPLFNNLRQNPVFYFVHSYHLVPDSAAMTVATCSYGKDFVVAVQKNNIFATQFHPEKSQTVGLKILANFLSWQGS